MNNQVQELLRRGVRMPCPDSVEVDEQVVVDRIAPGVRLHAGTRLRGAATSIGPGSEIGAEAPATIEDCQLGANVHLKGGYFSGATFLAGANLGSGAHVRPGTLLEEEAGGAHTVGLKQTIFLPFVTAGSLINFCDALMAGGTTRKDHSEIGSSYIHFNFTPHQDKATASLIGDVPRGVMLDQPPIFLGGQGGLVGPVRIAYGTVIPAGIICRQDISEPCQVYQPPEVVAGAARPFRAGAYRAVQRLVSNNLVYLGNIMALERWYTVVRQRVLACDPYGAACYAGALAQLKAVATERRKRLQELAERMPRSLELARQDSQFALPPALVAQQQMLVDRWPEMAAWLQAGPPADTGAAARDHFLAAWEKVDVSVGYADAIRQLTPAVKNAGTAWLQAVVDAVASGWPGG